MGERKVINKYFPPDFDHTKIPRMRTGKGQQHKIRMMVPMSIRCNRCGNYIYKGTKFNARKETVTGEAYHGIDVFRFYFRCTRCSQELTIKTDPENSDYVAELNCTRNFDMRKEEAADVADQKKQRKEEEELDAMKQLENRTMDSRMEMEILDALDEIKSLNARQQRLDTTDLLAMVEIQHDEEEAARKNLEELDGLEDRDLEELKALEDRGGIYIRRTYDHEEEDRFEKLHAKIMEAQQKKKELEAAHKFKAPVPRLAPRKSAAADKKIHDSLVVLVNNNEAVEKKPVASLLAIDDEEDEESGGLVSYGGADD